MHFDPITFALAFCGGALVVYIIAAALISVDRHE